MSTISYTTAGSGSYSTTWDNDPGIILRISVDESPGVFRYLVRDFVGLRHGSGNTIGEAVDEWAAHVEFLLTEPEEKLSLALRDECARYRKALGRTEGPS